METIVDAAGSAVVEYGYDAWGKVLCTKGSKAEGVGKDNLFRYRGYAYDEETPGMGTVFEYGSSVGKKRRIVEPQFIHILQKFTLISILGYKIELRKYDYGCRYADFSHIRGSEPNTCLLYTSLPHIISEMISLSKINNRYGFIDWNKGLDPEFSKIVKWIIRSLRS